MGVSRPYRNAPSATLAASSVGLLTLLLLALSVPAAYPSDHRVPRVMLRTGEMRQRGVLQSLTWIRRGERHCSRVSGVGLPDWPRGLEHRSGELAVLRFRKRQAPTSVAVVAWRGVNRSGVPRGEGETIPFVLSPLVSDGEVVAWEATFLPAPTPRHYFIEARAEWTDMDGCGGTQSGTWVAHLRVVEGTS